MGQWDFDLVDEWVDDAALTPISRFYPTAVAKDSGLSLTDVFSRLLELVSKEKLSLIWEIRCPDCFRTLGQVNDRSVQKGFFCIECGEDKEISKDMVFPVFTINPAYKAYIRGKKKQKSSTPEKVLGRFSRGQYRQLHCPS